MLIWLVRRPWTSFGWTNPYTSLIWSLFHKKSTTISSKKVKTNMADDYLMPRYSDSTHCRIDFPQLFSKFCVYLVVYLVEAFRLNFCSLFYCIKNENVIQWQNSVVPAVMTQSSTKIKWLEINFQVIKIYVINGFKNWLWIQKLKKKVFANQGITHLWFTIPNRTL